MLFRSSRVLQMPASRIRVIAAPNGGGFGGKCDPANHEMVVAKAALLLGRPVKIALSMEEQFYTLTKHPTTFRIRSAVKDGRIKRNDLLLLEGIGGGLAWGASLVRW